ncbi:hypothetical protein [Haloarcula pellucida]|uniref:Uncharacterized protein n=1 Tax=Haloarcula pellucida TaxID=1427151 RepID=A0A830GL56_9EURY|nr:hypothetical protein [Halomicroarcula pellucida]MBX0349886.1 hypothetical protein [Halomicroarcula pellucida]GGN94823.1 hypothetical protein GCM10009030_21550 [Halomicroarcula pellucida]
MSDKNPTRRRILLGASTLVGLAGCTSLGADEATTPETTQQKASDTASPTETVSQTATEEDVPGYIEDHWHGRLFVEIDGDIVDFAQPKYYLDNIEDERPETVYFHFHDSAHGPNEWSNEKQVVTFERALNLLPGIEYTRRDGDHVVGYEGTTYDGADDGTDVSVHRGTERIDPTTYEVENGDDFWVSVRTAEGSTAGSDRSGQLVVDVNNRRLNEGGETFRRVDTDQFEFRDDGERYRWYNTGEPVTVAEALGALPNVEYRQDSAGDHVFDYGTGGDLGGTYHDAADATEILVRQRATPVDPTTYELQDGDVVWVYVHTDNAPNNN